MPVPDRALPIAHYTAGPEENSVKNTGGKGRNRARSAQNTPSERLKSRNLSKDSHHHAAQRPLPLWGADSLPALWNEHPDKYILNNR
jgi:hypothetical protein